MNTPENFEEIKTRWQEFEKRTFPLGNRAVQCGGQSITVVHSEVAGFILSYLYTSGSLGSRQRIALTKAVSNLANLSDEITEEGRIFFTELCEIAKLVLDSAHDQPA